MNPIAEECIALIAKQKSISPGQIRLDSTLEELSLDSLDRVSIAFDLEEKYDIEIPEEKLGQIKTVKRHGDRDRRSCAPEERQNLPQPHDARGHHRGGLR